MKTKLLVLWTLITFSALGAEASKPAPAPAAPPPREPTRLEIITYQRDSIGVALQNLQADYQLALNRLAALQNELAAANAKIAELTPKPPEPKAPEAEAKPKK